MLASVVYKSRRVLWREAMAAMRCSDMRTGESIEREEGTNLVLCTLCI